MYGSWCAVTLAVVAAAAAPGSAAARGSAQNGQGVVDAVEPFSPEAVGRAVGGRRIVLLGENGHGVAEFTDAKVEIVRYLHDSLDFNVLAFESGFHECATANARLARQPVEESFHDCLIYQLEHEQLEALFAFAREVRGAARPLTIAGIDLQVQGGATRTRPALFRAALRAIDPALGDTIAVLDSVLIEESLEARDGARGWIDDHGPALRVLYDSAAALTAGDTSWTLRTASALLRRELYRAAATAYGLEAPTDVYAIRDEWMARTVAYLADPDRGDNKVIVWLHNDHARYGAWRAGPLRIRSTGWWLHEWAPDEVFSVGFFMGGGTYADNSRRSQEVGQPAPGSVERTLKQAGGPVTLLRLRDPRNDAVRVWGEQLHPYVRGGSPRRMRPGSVKRGARVRDAQCSSATATLAISTRKHPQPNG